MRRRRPSTGPELHFAFQPPSTPPARPRRPRRRRIRWLRLSLVAFLLFALATISAFFGFMTAIAHDFPSLDQYVYHQPHEVGLIYARDGSGRWVSIGTLRSADARYVLRPDQISSPMKQAIIAIEDRRFYDHKGFDPQAIIRAVFKRVVQGSAEGGSTITQQLIKNVYLGSRQTVQRKIREIALAYQLERQWHSKQKILTAYLNTIYFGHGCYGVQAAAKYYFGTNAWNLDVGSSALLAALPKSPTQFDPFAHPVEARQRRDLVLDDMVAQHFVTADVAAVAKAQALVPTDVPHRLPSNGATRVPYFVEYVTQQLINRYGAQRTFGGGLRVYTSLDLREQALAEDAVRKGLRGVGPDGALVSIEPTSGQVKAMVGGSDFKQSPFNIATDGRRQPGSSFKPFVLLAALHKGIQTSTYFDSRKLLLDIGINGHPWPVRNDTPSYLGPITLRHALAVSDNTVFAQLTLAVGPSSVVTEAHRAGITSPLDPIYSIGLGTTEVSPLEMAHAYATIANRGVRVGGSLLFHTPDAAVKDPSLDPISIVRVKFPNGKVEENKPASREVAPEVDALSTIDAMRDVITSGTGKAAALPHRIVAGKTGTTSDFKDAWFVGMTPQRVASVWVGYAKTPKPMLTEFHGHEVLGGTYPALIWRDFMGDVLNGAHPDDWPSSPGLNAEPVLIDTRKAAFVRAPSGCPFAHELVLAFAKVPQAFENDCPRNLSTVQDLSGDTAAQAARKASAAGLDFTVVTRPAAPGEAVGHVVDQLPSPNTSVPIGSPLEVTIPVSVPYVYVPQVTSSRNVEVSAAEAVARLRAARLRVVFESQPRQPGLNAGTVVGQDVEAATQAPVGTVVHVTVAGDPHGVRIPNVIGRPLSKARLALAHVGLGVRARAASGGRARESDDVADITGGLHAGDLVPTGSPISLTTARRRP